ADRRRGGGRIDLAGDRAPGLSFGWSLGGEEGKSPETTRLIENNHFCRHVPTVAPAIVIGVGSGRRAIRGEAKTLELPLVQTEIAETAGKIADRNARWG